MGSMGRVDFLSSKKWNGIVRGSGQEGSACSAVSVPAS